MKWYGLKRGVYIRVICKQEQMKNLLLILMALLTTNLQSQDEILTDENLYPFILKVDSLNQEFDRFPRKDYFSIQQTNADYVRIITKDPERFINDLNSGISPKQIIEKYDNAVVDKNVLITKTKYTNYKGENSIQFQSYKIGSNSDHSVKIPFEEKLFNQLELKGKYFYDNYSKGKGTTRIDAFFILSDFKLKKLDAEIASCLDYSDWIIGKEKVFRYAKTSEIPDSVSNPIDSLLSFYNKHTEKPKRQQGESYSEFKERLNLWNNIKQDKSDSLFIANRHYRELLVQSKEFAKQTHLSNSFLEHLVERYISKEESLNLMRLSPTRGKQSFDSSPINQQLRLCKTSAELSNWDVFIKSLIDIMNDNMDRSVDNSLVRASRKTYFSELEKLPIDLPKLLIGMSLKTSNPNDDHYWGSGDRIGKAIANSNNPDVLIDAFIDVIRNDEIDQFNKLHFYNILKNTEYFTKDEKVKEKINKALQINKDQYGPSILDRMKDSHLELKNLLIRDSIELQSTFEIESSVIGHITTSYSDGDTWIGEFKPKNVDQNIFFNVIMRADTTLNSIKKLCSKKDSMVSKVVNNQIFKEFMFADTSSVSIKYIIDRSYIEKKRCCNQEIPENIKNKYKGEFDKAIMLDTNKGKKKALWILFPNGDAMITQLAKDFELENHKFDMLMTIEKEKKFGKSDYFSFKIFDKQGNIVNVPTGNK
jgi:hypothetical protein